MEESKLFKEYDAVRANKRLNINISKGEEGTILMVFEGEDKEYEVEFVDEEGNTLDILTVRETDLEIVK